MQVTPRDGRMLPYHRFVWKCVDGGSVRSGTASFFALPSRSHGSSLASTFSTIGFFLILVFVFVFAFPILVLIVIVTRPGGIASIGRHRGRCIVFGAISFHNIASTFGRIRRAARDGNRYLTDVIVFRRSFFWVGRRMLWRYGDWCFWWWLVVVSVSWGNGDTSRHQRSRSFRGVASLNVLRWLWLLRTAMWWRKQESWRVGAGNGPKAFLVVAAVVGSKVVVALYQTECVLVFLPILSALFLAVGDHLVSVPVPIVLCPGLQLTLLGEGKSFPSLANELAEFFKVVLFGGGLVWI